MRETVEIDGVGSRVEGALALEAAQAREGAAAERRRVAHVRALVLGRRGEADKRRRAWIKRREERGAR
jgi:hypothetical protein